MKEGSIDGVSSKIDINLALLGIGFVLFTLIITLNPLLLKENYLLAMELTLVIPLLITSCSARIKNITHPNNKVWKKLGFYTYLFGYAMLINVVGIFLQLFVNFEISLLFFGLNIFMALLYSIFEIIEKSDSFSTKWYKDLLFILLLVFGGILPAMGIY